jgi:hypothetical protein
VKVRACLVVLLGQIALAQVKSGTIVSINFAQDEITIAADSRVSSGFAHADTECKIAAFGPKVVFTMSGLLGTDQWNAQSVARKIWERESKAKFDSPLLPRVVNGWVEAVEPFYGTREVIAGARQHMVPGGDPVVVNAFFATVNQLGQLEAEFVIIDFDVQLYDSTGGLKLIPSIEEASAGMSYFMGHGETVMEFRGETTQRAKDYMSWFNKHIADLPTDLRRAELASKYVKLTILLNPRQDELGFPIDVLQLRRDGAHWVSVKPNCQTN